MCYLVCLQENIIILHRVDIYTAQLWRLLPTMMTSLIRTNEGQVRSAHFSIAEEWKMKWSCTETKVLSLSPQLIILFNCFKFVKIQKLYYIPLNKMQCLQSQRIYESTFKSEHITTVQFQHLNA